MVKNKKVNSKKVKKLDLVKITAEKYSVSEEEVRKELEDIKSKVKEEIKDRDMVIKHRLRSRFKNQAKSPAKLFEGVIVKIRFIKDMHKNAIKAYETNIDEGLENGIFSLYKIRDDDKYDCLKLAKDGEIEELIISKLPSGSIKMDSGVFIVPMDPREKTSTGNENYKYLEEMPENSAMYSLKGVCRKKGEKKFTKFTMLTDEVRMGGIKISDSGLLMYTPVTFKALDWGKSNEDDSLFLGASTVTKFTKIDNFDISVEDIIVDNFSDEYNLICELDDLHNEYIKEAISESDTEITELDVRGGVDVVTQGYVIDMYLENDWKSMIIDDDSMEDTDPDFYGLKVMWGPVLNEYIHLFANESKVIVLGTTSKGKKWDKTTKTSIEDELGEVSIFANGIYPIPEMNTINESENVNSDTYLKEVSEKDIDDEDFDDEDFDDEDFDDEDFE